VTNTALAPPPVEAAWPLASPPWSHQLDAFTAALPHPGFMLAHGMGAGKSATALAIAEHDQARRVLVLCPKSVVDVWPDQLEQHSHQRWFTWSGQKGSVARRAEAIANARGYAERLHQPFAAIVNYEASFRDGMSTLLCSIAWDVVILDESHRIKLPGGKASRLAADVCQRTRERGGRVLALTGTPMPHTPLDLWAQMRALDGGQRLGTNYRKFCVSYGLPDTIRVPGGKVREIYKGLRPDRVSAFTATVGLLMDRVETTDVIDLPATTDTFRVCHLTPKAQRVYDQLEKDLIAETDGHVITAANAMVLALRLAQTANGFGRDADTDRLVELDGTPAKARLLADVLEDFPDREPVVVFCRFHADLDAVEAVCAKQGRRYGELSGRRRDALDGPRMDPHIDVAAVQLQSGGVGIDLTRARHALYYSLDFRLADHEQSRARLHRPGQTRPVVYTYLLTEGTIDRAIHGALRRRQQVVDAVLAYLKAAAR
jgi:SNF2 family DNA or RNA helicase